MQLFSAPPLERATPLFGTLVRIRVEACSHDHAMEASSKAISAMARVHRLMSFHDPESELSDLNRSAHRKPIQVSEETAAVVAEAINFARLSDGVFDPTVAPAATCAGTLPRPDGAPTPSPRANWKDVEVDRESMTVRFRRALWLDLGGIAKGYAVDLAVGILRRESVPQACVNAGGDLRVFGPAAETVALDPGPGASKAARAAHILNGSLASSGSAGPIGDQRALAVHFDGKRRRLAPRRFVTVLAKRCLVADALTKVVLARGCAAGRLLEQLGASAAICSPALRWSTCGARSDD